MLTFENDFVEHLSINWLVSVCFRKEKAPRPARAQRREDLSVEEALKTRAYIESPMNLTTQGDSAIQLCSMLSRAHPRRTTFYVHLHQLFSGIFRFRGVFQMCNCSIWFWNVENWYIPFQLFPAFLQLASRDRKNPTKKLKRLLVTLFGIR